MRSSVDLPIPFGPTMPTRSPGPTRSDTRSSTVTEPYDFVISCAASEPDTGGPPSGKGREAWCPARGRAWDEPGGSRRSYLVTLCHERRDPSARLAAAHGRPEEEDVEGAARQAARDAQARGTARERVPAVRLAQAAAPRLPDLRDVQGPRGRAAPARHAVVRGTRRRRRAWWRQSAWRSRRRRRRRCGRRRRGHAVRAGGARDTGA